MAGESKRLVDLLPSSAGTEIPDEVRDVVEEALDVEGSTSRVVPGGFLVSIPVTAGRRQAIQILGVAEVPTGGPGLRLVTICAPAQAERFDAMLRMNANLALGAIEVRSLGGKDHLVLSAIVPAAGLVARALRAGLRYLAERGDRLEQLLTGADRR